MRTKLQNQILRTKKSNGKYNYCDLKMSNNTYKLRRKVINYIYDIKNRFNLDLPRIEVRISTMKKHIGLGWYGQNIIRIKDTLKDDKLKSIVLHEIGHAVFYLFHDDNCILMNPYTKIDKYSIKEIENRFLELYNKYKSNK